MESSSDLQQITGKRGRKPNPNRTPEQIEADILKMTRLREIKAAKKLLLSSVA